MTLYQKYQTLRAHLKSLGSAVVAFSAGVDSTFLLYVAHDVLGESCVAVTAASHSLPKRELEEAKAFCSERGIRHIIVESEELEIEGFRQNPKNRCYLCKRELFTKLRAVAQAEALTAILEGSKLDDEGDYRPGLQAVAELKVESPLRRAGFTKEDIRALSREFGLPTAEKQSFACLSSRFAYGETISEDKLSMVDRAEQLLLDLGFHQVRVRVHGDLARIEVGAAELSRVLEHREKIDQDLRGYGFAYVSLDLRGYRTGSMNEVIGHV